MGNGGVGMQWMLRIRKARREDARSIGACHYHCWQETYSGLISDEYLAAMNEAQNMERFEGLYLQTGRYQYVVLDGSQIVGFFDISPAREEYAPYEVQGLYLRKSYHGHGYGRTIMDHIKKECGAAPFYLWCLSTNSTCGYYVHMGGKEIARKDIWIGKQKYEVTCFLFET